MKKILIACLCLLLISGCTSKTKKKSVPSTTKDTNSSQNVKLEEKSSVRVINVKIGNETFKMTLEDNKSAQSLLSLLPLELSMAPLNGNEYYAELDNSLNAQDESVTIKKGDVMLYKGNTLVFFYKDVKTSYKYTKIGHIEGDSLASALKKADGEASLSV